jgi:hypothetical protein
VNARGGFGADVGGQAREVRCGRASDRRRGGHRGEFVLGGRRSEERHTTLWPAWGARQSAAVRGGGRGGGWGTAAVRGRGRGGGPGSEEQLPKTLRVVGEVGGGALERAPEGAPLWKVRRAAASFCRQKPLGKPWPQSRCFHAAADVPLIRHDGVHAAVDVLLRQERRDMSELEGVDAVGDGEDLADLLFDDEDRDALFAVDLRDLLEHSVDRVRL